MTDKELLELAAKAAGIEIFWKWSDSAQANVPFTRHEKWYAGGARSDQPWTPLTDDGDALRLAIKLEIAITFGQLGKKHVRAEKTTFHHEFGFVWPKSVEAYELLEEDTGAATRRAIVRAAAEIGKDMQ